MRALILTCVLACAALLCLGVSGVSADGPLPVHPFDTSCISSVCTWGPCSGASSSTLPNVQIDSSGLKVYVPALLIFGGFYAGFGDGC